MKLLVSALEHSANVHLKALKAELGDDVELIGIFDSSLGKPVVDLRSLAIMGFVDALKKLRYFFKLADEMVALAAEADKVLLMDSSGFNLPLAKKIKKRYPDKEIIYYILPQAWAWKRKRIPVLERTIDRLASILPFEKDYYSPQAPIEYVGHPLLDEIAHFKTEAAPTLKRVAFMPGSRKSEIRRLMPVFRELRSRLDAEAVLVVPKHFAKEELNDLYGNLSPFIVAHDAHAALYESDFAFICSGTATLEASLIGTPFVLAYVAKPLDYLIAKSLVKLDYIGLANIMFSRFKGRPLHPELIQNDVTAEALLGAMQALDRQAFLEDAKALRGYLEHGSSARVAHLIEGEQE
ncbi:lipid-A-disaccharide synthase [Sulfurimonas diazotrophicus]|uniref:Lipid-A-disaccharide synthase n=1 Tax=Sulfurimonas diazotrophicus TaxID=3131939 RepID=A0ABZ3H6X5_9BACT